MADKADSVTVPAGKTSNQEAQAAPAKKRAAKPKEKKPTSKPAHPLFSEMVNAAIQSLNERGGSSLQAIKKYIVATYMVDAEKQAPYIKRYLKSAVARGVLTQTKGKGATGSFKMAAPKSEALKPKVKTAAPKPSTPKKKAAGASAAPPAKKPRAPRKAAVPKKATSAAAEKRTKTPRSPVAKPPKAKSPSKAKKAVKAPTNKPKAPKPKKAAPAAAKKTAATKNK